MLPLTLVVVVNSLLSVPPSQWQGINLQIPEHGTTVDVSFRVESGSRVQVMVLEPAEAERFHRGRSFEPLFTTGFQNSGRIRYRIREAGSYVLMIDNRLEGRGPTMLDLRVELTNPGSVHARELPAERRRAVVALSMVFFGVVVIYSARQFLKNSKI